MRKVLSFLLVISLLSCKKDRNAIISDDFYFKGKINGEMINWTVNYKNSDDLPYRAGASRGYSDLSDSCVNGYCYYLVGYTEIYKNNAETMPQINVGYSNAAHTGEKAELESWFSPGIKNFGTYRTSQQLLDSSKNGINIYYIDQNHKSWSSLIGDQIGSTFESISLTVEKRPEGIQQYEKIWKARFSCKLYDDKGNFIKIDDGEICGPVIPK